MFTTQSQHRRSALGHCHRAMVDDNGLGLTVEQSTKFDPRRMEARYQYWRRLLADELANQYREAGYVGGLSGLVASKYTPGMLQTGKIPILADILGVVAKVPIVGKMFCGIFGGCKKPKVPWGKIYAQVEPIARQYAREEEESRIAEEKYTTETVRQTTGEQRSREAAVFKMPEGTLGIRRGAIQMVLKGGSVEKRI